MIFGTRKRQAREMAGWARLVRGMEGRRSKREVEVETGDPETSSSIHPGCFKASSSWSISSQATLMVLGLCQDLGFCRSSSLLEGTRQRLGFSSEPSDRHDG